MRRSNLRRGDRFILCDGDAVVFQVVSDLTTHDDIWARSMSGETMRVRLDGDDVVEFN